GELHRHREHTRPADGTDSRNLRRDLRHKCSWYAAKHEARNARDACPGTRQHRKHIFHLRPCGVAGVRAAKTSHENCQFGNSLSLMHAIDGGIPCVQFLGRDSVGRRYSAFAGFPSPNQKTAMWLLRSRRSASTTLSFTCERENGPRSPTPAASNAWVYPPLDGESIRSRWAGRGARRRQASSPIRGRSPSRSHSRKLARSRGG